VKRGEIFIENREENKKVTRIISLTTLNGENLFCSWHTFKRPTPKGLYRTYDDPSPTQTSTIQSALSQKKKETRIQSKLEKEPKKKIARTQHYSRLY